MKLFSKFIFSLLLFTFVYCNDECQDISDQVCQQSSVSDESTKLGVILQTEELDVSELDRNKTKYMVAERKSPLIIKNVLTQEDLQRLNLPWFCEAFDDILSEYNIGVKLSKNKKVIKWVHGKTKKTYVGAFCNLIMKREYKNKNEAPYMAKFERNKEYQRLKLPMERFHWLFEKLPTVSIWLGTKNSWTPLHLDNIPNFSLQISGVKQWTLFANEQCPHLCFLEDKPQMFAWSKYDLDDENTCPTGIYADRWIVNMQPGDVLFLPKLFPHFCKNLDNNLMINFWVGKGRFGKDEEVFKYKELLEDYVEIDETVTY